MHILPEELKRGKKNRLGSEKLMKKVNMVMMIVQLTCFLIVVSQVSIAAGKTFRGDFWFPQAVDFSLDLIIEGKTANCTYVTTKDTGGWSDVPVTITPDNRGFMMATTAGILRISLILNGVFILIGSINKLLFDLNVFAWRYHNVVIRKEILTCLELLLIALSFGYIDTARSEAGLYKKYLKFCGYQSSNTVFHTLPFVPLYVSLSMTLFLHAITFMLYLKNALKKDKPTNVDFKPSDPQMAFNSEQEMLAHQQQMQQQYYQQQQQHAAQGSVVAASVPQQGQGAQGQGGFTYHPQTAPGLRTMHQQQQQQAGYATQ